MPDHIPRYPNSTPRYIVGIDLGTTHCAMAYVDLQHPQQGPRLFPIDQLVAPGEVAARPLFPSCRYHPYPEEFHADDVALPWADRSAEYGETVQPVIQGELARHLSGKSLGRSVASAKSWLCHGQVDREEPILPWGAPEGVGRVSPLLATAGFLHHLRSCWDWHHRDGLLAGQYVVLTVPASFDEDARQLTLRAAKLAGIPVARLLEEPTAAFYAWYWEHRDYFDRDRQGKTLLVCDVGGGTTDLTLLRVTPDAALGRPPGVESAPTVERIGVGDHLLLGGDNMDLAVAWLAESSLGGKLSATSMQQLAEESRRAKEQCLTGEGSNGTGLTEAVPETLTVTLLGGGSKLIGGSRIARLNAGEVRQYLLDNFFPHIPFNADLARSSHALVESGLPYERDPAISKHILRFVRQHRAAIEQTGAGFPDAVLFNGGPFNSRILRRHLLKLFQDWRGEVQDWQGGPLEELHNELPDTSVALGAVVHGLALKGHFARVTGGSARHYFLLTENEARQSIGVCLLPRGTPEAMPLKLENRRFKLTVGQTVAFRIATSTEERLIGVGEILNAAEHWNQLPPLVVRLDQSDADGADQGSQTEIEVLLQSELTEVGTLQLSCVDAHDPHKRWQLEFQTRQRASASTANADLHPGLGEARQALSSFLREKKQDNRSFKALREELERILGQREAWSLADIRVLADALLDEENARRRSPWHERAWLHWLGFSLRPGVGHPLDADRLQRVWHLFQSGVIHQDDQNVWSEWWNMWRRVAAGLSSDMQQSLLDEVAYYLHPSNTRSRKRQTELAQRAYDDLVRLLGALEDIGVEQKVEAGGWLFERVKKSGESPHTWWALGRIGVRLPFSGKLNRVVPARTVSVWLQELLKEDWRKHRVAALAATLMARKSGDRALDIDEPLRQKVLQQLKQSKAPERWLQLVQEVVELDQSDQGSLFGESLPSGLSLITD